MADRGRRSPAHGPARGRGCQSRTDKNQQCWTFPRCCPDSPGSQSWEWFWKSEFSMGWSHQEPLRISRWGLEPKHSWAQVEFPPQERFPCSRELPVFGSQTPFHLSLPWAPDPSSYPGRNQLRSSQGTALTPTCAFQGVIPDFPQPKQAVTQSLFWEKLLDSCSFQAGFSFCPKN